MNMYIIYVYIYMYIMHIYIYIHMQIYTYKSHMQVSIESDAEVADCQPDYQAPDFLWMSHMMVSKGNHPKMTLIEVSELL